MEYFDLTFRFDNEEQPMSRYNGLPLGELIRFFNALYKTIPGDKSQLVLSEVKGNCYAPVVSTPNPIQYDAIKNLHSRIASGDYGGFNKNERNYTNTIIEMTSGSISLNVYDKEKKFYKSYQKIKPPKEYQHFYETQAIKGVLTRIGGRNLDSKISIFVNTYPHEIIITAAQDKALSANYKSKELEFHITERINKKTEKVDLAVLDSFKVLEASRTLYDNIKEVRKEYGSYFASETNDNE